MKAQTKHETTLDRVNRMMDEELDDEQRAAARDTARRVQAIACAGSGKSRTLVYRIARLVAEGEDPGSIVAFTFTNKAAHSMKRKAADVLKRAGMDPTVLGSMYIGTIDGFCNRILREVDARYAQFDILDPNRLMLFLMTRYGSLGLQHLKDRAGGRYFETLRQVAAAWGVANEEGLDLDAIEAADSQLGHSLKILRDLMDEQEYIDFSQMVRLIADGLRDGKDGPMKSVEHVRHLMVDEYQDINPMQEALIEQIDKRCKTLFVVGDDDQAIYAWRGADVNNCLGFATRYPDVSQRTLVTNYRSTAAIVAASDGFARQVLSAKRLDKNPVHKWNPEPRHLQKAWFTSRQEEADWVAQRIQDLLGTEYQEAESENTRGLTPADFAVLMRSTKQTENDDLPRHLAFTRALAARGIPYTLEAGGSPFDRPQVAVLRDAFKLLRTQPPSRSEVTAFYKSDVLPNFPRADLERLCAVTTDWGNEIHGKRADEGARRRVYPQNLLLDLLAAFGAGKEKLADDVMSDIGVFSRILQDVESVFTSVDSKERFAMILNFLENVADGGYDTSTGEVVTRPDAVTVSTIHQVKGLEYPVVFVVDLESQRFPRTKQNATKYEGWIPKKLIQKALDRGAYVSSYLDEARLFYTAVTRAERYLHLSGAENLPGGVRARKQSDFLAAVDHDELTDDPAAMPAGLAKAEPRRREDESILPSSYSELRYYLSCPKNYQFRKRYGFSPPVKDLFGFGRTVHASIGKIHELYPKKAPTPEQAEQVVRETFHLKHVNPAKPGKRGPYEVAEDAAVSRVRQYVKDHAGDFTSSRQVEEPFEIAVEGAVIAGTIDLLVDYDPTGKPIEASVVDFKSAAGGDNPRSNEDLHWEELALQVQLYARAANEILGRATKRGSVHLLKDGKREDVPISDEAQQAAIDNVQWAVNGIRAGHFPMRPHGDPQDLKSKCGGCDFLRICPRASEPLPPGTAPPDLFLPGEKPDTVRRQAARCFDAWGG